MNTPVSALLALAATLVVGASAFAAPVNSGPMRIADIGRDNMELSQIHEVLPTVSYLLVDFPELQES
jgi:hypothetical protein